MAKEIQDLVAEARAGTGKGAARQARRNGKVPGIVYGDGKDPSPIQMDFNPLLTRLRAGRFMSTLFNLKVEGQDDVRVICRGVQRDVVKDLPGSHPIVIASNGAVLYDLGAGELLDRICIDPAVALTAVGRIRAQVPGVSFAFESGRRFGHEPTYRTWSADTAPGAPAAGAGQQGVGPGWSWAR